MTKYIVTDIDYDTDGQRIKLPKQLEVLVPDDIQGYEDIEDYISNEISNQTGFCHLGYQTVPEIPE